MQHKERVLDSLLVTITITKKTLKIQHNSWEAYLFPHCASDETWPRMSHHYGVNAVQAITWPRLTYAPIWPVKVATSIRDRSRKMVSYIGCVWGVLYNYKEWRSSYHDHAQTGCPALLYLFFLISPAAFQDSTCDNHDPSELKLLVKQQHSTSVFKVCRKSPNNDLG